jgi:hypothetical protein
MAGTLIKATRLNSPDLQNRSMAGTLIREEKYSKYMLLQNLKTVSRAAFLKQWAAAP